MGTVESSDVSTILRQRFILVPVTTPIKEENNVRRNNKRTC